MMAVAIVCHPTDFQRCCYRALARFSEQGFSLETIIIAAHNWNRKQRTAVASSAGKLGDVVLVDEFDNSAVSQENVRKLRELLENKSVSIVLMPFTKSLNAYRRIVGMSSLLAARSIQNVLMYEPDSRCKDFVPQIHFEPSGLNGVLPSSKASRTVIESRQTGARASRKLDAKAPEAFFQSHRLILNSDCLEVLERRR